MVQRTIEIKKSAIKNIFKVSAFIESKGLPQTAKQFSHEVYDAIIKLGNPIVRHSYCRDIKRRAKELKCISFKKKYVIVYWENDSKIIINEFILGSQIH